MQDTSIAITAPTDSCAPRQDALTEAFIRVRQATEALSARLTPEDQCLQSMPDCSPTKWHRAHTTWFFEEFLLCPAGYESHRKEYGYLFNSYYDSVGSRHPRPQRGVLSRPSCTDVAEYRRAVDERMLEWLGSLPAGQWPQVAPLLELGIAHEQQHQELLLTDILHAFAQSPLKPVYHPRSPLSSSREQTGRALPLHYKTYGAGVVDIGAAPDGGFHFDNEGPRHRVFLEAFELAERPILYSEVKAFIEMGGYADSRLWLAEGFDWVKREGRGAPLHSQWQDGELLLFTLRGEMSAQDDMIASQLSYYEADAIARFLGARLPTEQEWEWAACAPAPADASAGHPNWVETERFLPGSIGANAPAPMAKPQRLFGDVWEWTSSAYLPYPGYRPAVGAVGEYNGKFMVNQMVLRGGSCLTPAGHVRATYRNFWPPSTSFQMSGARVARSL